MKNFFKALSLIAVTGFSLGTVNTASAAPHWGWTHSSYGHHAYRHGYRHHGYRHGYRHHGYRHGYRHHGYRHGYRHYSHW